MHFITIGGFTIPAVMMILILGPALYFYCKKFYELDTKNFLWHIIPYQIGFGIIIYGVVSNIYVIPQWLFSLYYGSVLLLYFLMTLRLINKFSSNKHKTWMKTIGIGFGILVLLHLIEILLINFDLKSSDQTAAHNVSVQNIFTSLFFIVVIKQIISNPQPFSNVTVRIPNKHSNVEVNASELNLILSYIEGDKAYQNPDLKTTMVSEQTGLRTNLISEIINREFKKNFNEWINDYRIAEAKKLLSETEMNIKEVYYEVGFNSKSAFNTAFKERVKETPTSFRKK